MNHLESNCYFFSSMKKKLYVHQNYPDNYVPDSFLSGMETNGISASFLHLKSNFTTFTCWKLIDTNYFLMDETILYTFNLHLWLAMMNKAFIKPVTFMSCVKESQLVIQQLSLVFLYLLIFNHIHHGRPYIYLLVPIILYALLAYVYHIKITGNKRTWFSTILTFNPQSSSLEWICINLTSHGTISYSSNPNQRYRWWYPIQFSHSFISHSCLVPWLLLSSKVNYISSL